MGCSHLAAPECDRWELYCAFSSSKCFQCEISMRKRTTVYGIKGARKTVNQLLYTAASQTRTRVCSKRVLRSSHYCNIDVLQAWLASIS